MDPKDQTIEALQTALKAQSDLITNLKNEIERLKTQPTYFPPIAVPEKNPNIGPFQPFPGIPIQPLIPPQYPYPTPFIYGGNIDVTTTPCLTDVNTSADCKITSTIMAADVSLV